MLRSPESSVHTLLTSLMEKSICPSDVCGEAVTLTERGGSQGPLHCTGGLQRTKAQSAGRGSFTPGILKLRRPKSDGLWPGPGQTRRLSQKMKTKVGVVPHIWEILELPPTLSVSWEPASLPLFQVQPGTRPTHSSLGLAQAVSIKRLVSHTPFLSSLLGIEPKGLK